MIKRFILSVVAVFIAWSVLDFIIHGVLLQSTYEATAELWRPMEEMSMPLMHLVTLLYVFFFTAIYACLVTEKSVGKGLKYGVLFGLGAGISMGFGSYSYMPIPISLAWTWFAGMLVEAVVAGLLVGLIIPPQKAE